MGTTRKTTRKKNQGDLGGFTIIEVVLVLAIAGLIFLMVFIALPALQRSQRDTQRRSDLSRVASQITQYQTNNNGKLPGQGLADNTKSTLAAKDGDYDMPDCKKDTSTSTSAAACFVKNYMNGVNATENEFTDPDGWAYGVEISTYDKTGASKYAENFDHMVYIVKKAKCDGEVVTGSTNARDYAITYKLEGNGTYCADNGS